MSRVFRLHSTLEVPLEKLHEYFDAEPEYPPGVRTVTVERRKNTLLLGAVAEDEDLSKYTPTAQLKATVSEVRIQEEPEKPRWGAVGEDEEEPEVEIVKMAGFKGDRESVLQNTALQYEMFQVLVDLAQHAERGELTAITENDEDLHATRIVDGELRPATVEVVEDPSAAAEDGVDWRNNQYIGD
ncbi:MAG: hypothetical protein ABEJ42_08920 [Halobacteriaceae archaeon]